MVTHPSINRAKCRATTLIETNALLLSHTTKISYWTVMRITSASTSS